MILTEVKDGRRMSSLSLENAKDLCGIVILVPSNISGEVYCPTQLTLIFILWYLYLLAPKELYT